MGFLEHAWHYGVLSDCHVGYNRGLFTIEVDRPVRRVRFVPVTGPGSTPAQVGFIEDYPHVVQEQVQRINPETGRAFLDVIRGIPHHFEQGRVVVDDTAPLKGPTVNAALGAIGLPHDIQLDDSADLGGVSADEHRRFRMALRAWSSAALVLHFDAVRSGVKPDECVPVQLVPEQAFVAGMADIAGLPVTQVGLLLERLTFGAWGQKNPDIFLQPLVRGPSRVAWSPNVVLLSNADRNMLKLMARGPKRFKDMADNLIGGREHVTAHPFGELLKQEHGFQYKTGIVLPDGRGEIDLIAFHTRYPDEVLLIEVKGVLDVDEVNEMHQATQEMVGGQDQLRRVIGLLDGMTSDEKRRLWSQPRWEGVTNYYGVVLTPNSQPNPSYDHREFPAVTLETVFRRLRPRHFRSPHSFWKASVSKPWLAAYQGRQIEYVPLEVGGTAYELPMSFVPEDEDGPVPSAHLGKPQPVFTVRPRRRRR